MEMLSNRSFQLHTSNSQCSRLRHLKNGVPQGSVLAPLLFNIYIYDLPSTQSRKYGYADDLAILLSKPLWKVAEEGLNEDMAILSIYFKKWHLKLNLGKTFHLNNRKTARKLSIIVDKARLQFQSVPTYLGVKLDKTLTFKQHLESVKAKTTNRVALICFLAGTTWGAATKTLRTSTQALVFSAVEYCAPVWSHSHHVKKLDITLNIAMRTISGTLQATPVNQLPILAGIAQPPSEKKLPRWHSPERNKRVNHISTRQSQRGHSIHASNPNVPLPHMPISSLQHRQMSPRPTGSRPIGVTNGPLQNHPGCIASLKTQKTSLDKICYGSSRQPSIA